MTVGGAPREIHVEVEPEKAAASGYSSPRIASVIRKANTYRALGDMDEGSLSLPVTLEGRLSTLEDLKTLPLMPGITLENLARIRFAHRRADSICRIERRQCVSLHVKSSAPNLIRVSRLLRDTTDYWNRRGLETDIVYDRGRDLERSFWRVALALFSGMVLSGGLLAVFTRETRRTVILTSGQPVLLLVTLAVISAGGKALDSFLLAGLAVGTGMVLDAGLLITEAVRAKGPEGLRLLLPALLSSSGSSILALLPLFPLDEEIPGIASLALALTVLLGLSLVLPLLFIPAFYRDRDRRQPGQDPLTPVKEAILRGVSRFLNARCGLRRRRIPLSLPVSFALLAAGILCLLALPKAAGPLLQSPVVFACLEMDEGTALETVDADILAVADRISSHPAVERIQSTSRRSGGDLSVVFSPRLAKREEILEHLRHAGRDIHNGFLYIPEGRGRESASLEITLTGPEVRVLKNLAGSALGELLREPWAMEGVLHFKEDPPAYHFIPDRDTLASSGLSVSDIAGFLRWNLQGPVADKWQIDGREIDLRVMARDSESLTREDLEALTVTTGGAGPEERRVYRLDQLGSFIPASESSRIYRANRRHSVSFTVTGIRMDAFELDALAWDILDRVPLPPGYAFQPSSRLIETQLFYRKLRWLFILTVLLIFLLLAVERESLKQALIILLPLPLIMSFPVITLKILGKGIVSETLLGLILLVGLGINNGILLLDYIPREMSAGIDAVMAALGRRFNGMFLTTATSVMGLLPLLFTNDPFFVHLSLVLISGLAGSFFASLFIFPSVLIHRRLPE